MVRTFIRRCLNLGPRSCSMLLLTSMKRALRIPEPDLGRPLIGCNSIVFVCHGNILRSPFAAGLLAHRLGEGVVQHLAISSAGLRTRTGRSADDRGVAAAALYGVDLSAHRSRPMTRDIVDHADAVVVMDFANQADFLARFPESRSKLRLLGAFDPEPRRTLEIADPYMMDAAGVRDCYEEISRCIENLRETSGLAFYARVQSRAREASTRLTQSPARER